MLLVSFCVLMVVTGTIFFVNSDSFRHRTQPNQLPQLDHSERTEHHCSDQKIHNVTNSGGSFSSTKGTRVILFRPKLQQRDEIQRLAAEFYIRNLSTYIFLFIYMHIFSMLSINWTIIKLKFGPSFQDYVNQLPFQKLYKL